MLQFKAIEKEDKTTGGKECIFLWEICLNENVLGKEFPTKEAAITQVWTNSREKWPDRIQNWGKTSRGGRRMRTRAKELKLVSFTLRPKGKNHTLLRSQRFLICRNYACNYFRSRENYAGRQTSGSSIRVLLCSPWGAVPVDDATAAMSARDPLIISSKKKFKHYELARMRIPLVRLCGMWGQD